MMESGAPSQDPHGLLSVRAPFLHVSVLAVIVEVPAGGVCVRAGREGPRTHLESRLVLFSCYRNYTCPWSDKKRKHRRARILKERKTLRPAHVFDELAAGLLHS